MIAHALPLTCLLALLSAPAPAAAATVAIAPTDPSLRYEGRWEVRATGATTVTSGSRLFLRFTGTAVSARVHLLGITSSPQLYAYVDGVKSARSSSTRARSYRRRSPAAFPRLVAGAFGAALEQVGYGGQGLTRGGGGGVPVAGASLPLNFSASPATAFDADAVVVNHGINDVINQPAVTEAALTTAYLEQLRRIRGRYPGATIIALEPFGLLGEQSAYAGAAIQSAVARFADARTVYVATRGWVTATDFTDALHPNAEGHRKIAARLAAVITSLTT